MIAPAVLELVRKRADIVEIIGERLELKRKGRQFWACCPFHQENTASFSVHPERQIFKCFGCQKGGDLFGFLQELDGLSFPEAVKAVADRVGVELEGSKRPRRPISPPRRPPRDELRALWRASHRLDDPALSGRHPAAVGTALFLALRNFHPFALARLDLVRELPLPGSYRWPRWWPAKWAPVWRLAMLAFEPDGTPASLHARAINPGADPKTRWPCGYASGGLLFAERRGLALLRGKAPAELERVLIVEGMTDLLRLALVTAERPDLAVLGAASGGFSALADVRWPDRVRVFVATDQDPAGDGYAQTIAEALAPRDVVRLDIGSM